MCSRRGGSRGGVLTLSLFLPWLLFASLSPERATGRTDDDLMSVLDRVEGAGVKLQPELFATRADHGRAPRARIASAFLEFPALLKAVKKQRRKLDVKIKRRRGRGARRRALRDDLLWLEMSIALHLGRLDTAATALKLQKAAASSSPSSFTATDLLDLANRLLRLLQGNVLQYMIFREDIHARVSMGEFPVMAAAMVTAGGDRNHTEEISTTLAANIVCSLFDDAKILDEKSVWPRWNSARFTEMTYAGMLWQTATTGLDCFSDRIFDIGLRAQDKSARNRIATRLPLEIAGVTGRSKLAAAGKSGDESLKQPALATASTYGYVSVIKSMLKRGVCVDDKTYEAVLNHVDIIFSTSMPVLISFGRPCRPKMGLAWTMEEALVRRRAITKPAADQNMWPSVDCGIPVLSSDSDLTMTSFLKEYVYAGKPVLVRSTLNNQRFSRVVAALSSPETHWGTMEVPSSVIPYPDLFNFGCSGEDTCSGAANRRGTLNAYLDEVDKVDEVDAVDGAAAAPPHYIFTVCTEEQKQLFTERLPHFLEPPAGSPLKPLAIGLCEFYNGGKHTGSPPHWHVSAINVLVTGEKRWFLAPPRFSFHSRTPAKIWWHSESKALWQQENRSLECVQKAGDLLFVPRFWAHAVLNTNSVSGFALEFETPITRPKAAEPSIRTEMKNSTP
jgi:hypothetical protein